MNGEKSAISTIRISMILGNLFISLFFGTAVAEGSLRGNFPLGNWADYSIQILILNGSNTFRSSQPPPIIRLNLRKYLIMSNLTLVNKTLDQFRATLENF